MRETCGLMVNNAQYAWHAEICPEKNQSAASHATSNLSYLSARQPSGCRHSMDSASPWCRGCCGCCRAATTAASCRFHRPAAARSAVGKAAMLRSPQDDIPARVGLQSGRFGRQTLN